MSAEESNVVPFHRDAAADYVRAGWALVPIPNGLKGPNASGWNLRENCVTDVTKAKKLKGNIGLAHAFSATCSLDVDDLHHARKWLAERGIDADALLGDPHAVKISSGRPGRAKLLYRLATPLPSVKLAPFVDAEGRQRKALEFRCADGGNNTVQCVLPPSLHPDTGQPYAWEYNDPVAHYTDLLELPQKVRDLWDSLVARAPDAAPSAPTERADIDTVRAALYQHDPSVPEDEWHRALMAVHWETQGSKAGLDLADEWSKGGKNYTGRAAIASRWRSWKLDLERPLTLASLRVQVPASADDLEVVKLEAGSRPLIRVTGGDLHLYADDCERLMSDELYARERQLVRIGGVADLTEQSDIRRDAAQAVIVDASAQWLRRRLNKRARFMSYRRREKDWVTIDCPRDLVENIAGQGDWPTLHRLETIARAPFLRADGSICETPGYDKLSRVFYAPNGEFPPVPRNPTRADAEQALSDLLDPFEQFPFATDEARSAFAAAVLTEAVRSATGTSPMFFYTAPAAGTGKSLLSEMPSRIIHGTTPAMRPWADDEELRKTLFASLLAGDRSIGFDNLKDGSKVRSSVLCAFLTAATYADRKLGVSETPSLPNRAVVYATGNNINPAGDLSRRSIVIRLDANLERAALRAREFKLEDLRGHVADNRSRLLIAALTILAAHRCAGRPESGMPAPSFERWAKLARDPLLWLGMADPMGTQDQETEDDSEDLAEAFRMMYERSVTMQKPMFAASDVASWSDTFIGTEPLGDAISATGTCADPTDPTKVKYWLRGNKGRVAGGFKLEFRQGSRKWQISQLRVETAKSPDASDGSV